MKASLPLHVERLRAVGEPNRLRILVLLSYGELAVGELAQIMGQSQPRLSHHLKALSAAGVVERLPEGSWVFYGLPADGHVRDFLENILSGLDLASEDIANDLRRLKGVRADRAQAAASYFSDIADTWDTVRELHSSGERIEAALLDLAGEGPFQRVIDIGTGTGRMLTLFASRARRLDGIDFSHRMLTVARANLDRDKIDHAHVRYGDACAMPYEAGSADLVIIHQVLHFLDEPERAIAEAARILKPEGRLLVVDFARHELEFLRTEHGHRRLGIRAEALSQWAEDAGLTLNTPQSFYHPDRSANGLTVQVWLAEKVSQDRKLATKELAS